MYYDIIKLIDGTMYKVGEHVLGSNIEFIVGSQGYDEMEYEIRLTNGFISIPKTSVLWAFTGLK